MKKKFYVFIAIASVLGSGVVFASDGKVTGPVAASSASAADPGPAGKSPREEYDEAVRKGDSLCTVGNYFDAVLSYERASRIAYNNRLKKTRQCFCLRLGAETLAASETAASEKP